MFSNPSANEMKVEVKNNLTPCPFHIKDQFIARAGDAHISGDVFCLDKHFRNNNPVFIGEIIDAPDVFDWKNKDVDRSLGILVVECHDRIPAVYEVARFVTLDDLAENTIGSHKDFIPFLQYFLSSLKGHECRKKPSYSL
jgi:hypothetical protein